MGQKAHPASMRLGYIRQHASTWYAERGEYTENLIADLSIRDYLEEKLQHASVSSIHIERTAGDIKIIIHTARPGIVIGKKGEDVEKLRKELGSLEFMKVAPKIEIEEVRQPDMDAKLVARYIARQLENRVMFRRAMKKAVQNTMRLGALGVRVQVSGRLGGVEIARTEWYREGRVPLHTLRADIDYATAVANTTYGVIGVKVWLFKGEVLGGMEQARPSSFQPDTAAG